MDKMIAEGFILQQSAHQLYEEIVERYGQSNAPQLFELHNQLSFIQQGSDSIVQYYSKLKRVWEEIQLLDGFPDCDCGALDKCSCGILKKLLSADQKQKLIQLLVGLDRGYDNVTTNILSMDHLPNVNRAYYMLLQVERQNRLTFQQDNSPQTSAFVSMKQQSFQGPPSHTHPSYTDKRDGKRFKFDKSLRKCDYCKKTGHNMDQCFKLTGVYPEWFLNMKSKAVGTSSINKLAAHVGDTIGGSILGDTPSEFAADTSHQPSHVDSALVQAMYKEMMKMVENQAPSSHPSDLNSSVNFAVGLPDGTTKLVTISGTVKLNHKITLQHVLLIPNFTHNLLSVSKLLSHNNLVAIFTSSSYQFQDLTTNEIQAIGFQHAGLYKFYYDSSFSSADNSSSLLHISYHVSTTLPTLSVLLARLGHLSVQKMSKLSIPHKHNNTANVFCEPCILAKSHNTSFPISLSHDGAIFQLVHVDLWGPYRHASLSGDHYFITVLDDF
ncbi:uncharacterized protein LOC104896475 [Beta vulgaris subsp. vulgaris]|uniref:uncharacterized protein LOC104896475 n=1 Tax=Beta vulgaris subsp. vulgaris TaxID=3555 RepID=UPI002036CF3C|nr:uncharacterized protein LOC104896475 [Beta vulgaris subsp. vulgaris]